MESRADFREREGLILSQCRLESGLSQEYVARQMDVNIRTVRNWEEGLSPIRNDDLLMWFAVCKQSPWALAAAHLDAVCIQRYRYPKLDGRAGRQGTF